MNEGKRWLAEQLIWEKRFEELRRDAEKRDDALPIVIRSRPVEISARTADEIVRDGSFEAA